MPCVNDIARLPFERLTTGPAVLTIFSRDNPRPPDSCEPAAHLIDEALFEEVSAARNLRAREKRIRTALTLVQDFRLQLCDRAMTANADR